MTSQLYFKNHVYYINHVKNNKVKYELEFQIGYKCLNLSVYKWENSHTYHRNVLGEYVVSLSFVCCS